MTDKQSIKKNWKLPKWINYLPKGNGKKLAFSIIFILILIASIFAAQQIVRYFSKAGDGDVEIFFTPSSTILPPEKTITVFMDTKGTAISFARIVFTFDKNKIKIKSEPQIDFNEQFGISANKLDNINGGIIQITSIEDANNTGTYVFVLGLSPDKRDTPPSGVIALASFVFEPITTSQNESDQISFTDGDIQIVSDQTVELSYDLISTNLSLNPVQATDTPTATAISTSSPTATADSTATATATATSTTTSAPTEPPVSDGDIDGNGTVNIVDIGMVVDNYGQGVEAGSQFDPSGDGFVNIVDIGIIVDNYDI